MANVLNAHFIDLLRFLVIETVIIGAIIIIIVLIIQILKTHRTIKLIESSPPENKSELATKQLENDIIGNTENAERFHKPLNNIISVAEKAWKK